MDSASDNSESEKREDHAHASSTVHSYDVDVGAQLIAETDRSLTPQEASQLRYVVLSPALPRPSIHRSS
jgi:hypothetical protein